MKFLIILVNGLVSVFTIFKYVLFSFVLCTLFFDVSLNITKNKNRNLSKYKLPPAMNSRKGQFLCKITVRFYFTIKNAECQEIFTPTPKTKPSRLREGWVGSQRRAEIPHQKRVKEQKPPARGGFTPSEPPAGRSRFEAQGSFELCGARLKALP